jgi:predicted ATPase/class 3 adenylate cyclase
MIDVTGYTFLEDIDTGLHARMCRCVRQKDNKTVILKILTSEFPTHQEITNLEHEYYLLKQINWPGIIKAYDLINLNLTPILVLEDSNNQTLSSFLRGKILSLNDFFVIALQLAECLKGLHLHHIIHKDIKPANILIDPHTLSIKLTNLSIATKINAEVKNEMIPDRLEGTLAYMSPEQTGRMNRSIDYRTDFYSLGITFFEMLTGILPFESPDPLDIIYAHIAKSPPLVTDIQPKIPLMISAIVSKLLSKAPEERYANGLGLKYDLEQCATQWKEKNVIEHFVLGEKDSQDQLHLSNKLYGREEQSNQLLTIFENVCLGHNTLVLISGHSGIGKTSLVNEIYKPLTQRKGLFCAGKFEQLNRRPYSALVKAFQDIIKQVLAESDVKLEQIKQQLLKALGKNGQAIINVIPEVALIIGKQPNLPTLNALESENRFNLTLQNFIQVFAQYDHPLVLFLDDLQWADSASLKLIEQVTSNASIRYLLLIGAYRDNEIDTNPYLTSTLNWTKESGISYHTITLKPLNQMDVEHLLFDTFPQCSNPISLIAKQIINKTNGHPLFIHELLNTLYHEQLTYYSHETLSWIWDLKKIEERIIVDNLVDLFILKIQSLSEREQQTLKSAACIGTTFSLQLLATTTNQSLESTAAQLNHAQQMQLIIPLGDTSKVSELLANNLVIANTLSDEELQYRFGHDKILQAIHNIIPLEVLQHTHLNIGRYLLKEKPLAENDERLFDVLNHLIQAKSLITSASEREHLTLYNLWAGNKALSFSAYQTALYYFQSGLEFLDKCGDKNNYEIALALYHGQLQCLYLLGDFVQGDQCFSMTESFSKTNLHKAETYLIKIQAYAGLSKYQKVLENTSKALKLFQIDLPLDVSRIKVLLEMVKIHINIGWRPIENLDQFLKKATDPDIILLQKLYSNAIGAAYLLGNQSVYMYIVCKTINLSLTHGYTAETSFALIVYATVFAERFNQFKLAFAFSTLSTKLEKNEYSPSIASKNLFVKAYYINPWQAHLQDSIEILQQCFDLSIEIGNLEYSGYCMIRNPIQYNLGRNLSKIASSCERDVEYLKSLKNENWYYTILFLHLVVKQLQSNVIPPAEFERVIDEVLARGKMLGLSIYIRYAQLLYIIGDFTEAFKWSSKFYQQREQTRGMVISLSVGLLYHALALIQQYPTASYLEKRRYWRILKSIEKKFRVSSQVTPSNLSFIHLLISAEMAGIKNNNPVEAQRLYNEAISAATHFNYINYVALINECTARFYLRLGVSGVAKLYIQQAYYAYKRWGAHYKCQLLAEQYPDWISAMTPQESTDSAMKRTLSSPVDSNSLDLMAILKANQAIAKELDLNKVLKKLLQIAFENAGAEKGALFFEKQNQLFVVAEGINKQDIQVNINGTPLESHQEIPKLIITYVQRTHENLILNNEHEISKFQNDPYIQTNRPKSILCMPILQHGRAESYVYLENSLASNAFTSERLKILSLLGGQSAVSLENAKLYAASNRFVPYQFLRHINRHNLVEAQLGDQVQRVMTILFCDIRNFTTLSEQSNSAEIFKFINLFLGYMEPVIKRNQGFVDKYIGDAIMALFENPTLAVKAGLEMLKRLDDFNIESGYQPITIGIGINTGDLMLGIIGDQSRIEGSVLGDAVNIASRIENLTKQYPENILISESTKEQLIPSDFNLYFVGVANIKGKSKPVTIWGVKDKN